MSFQVIPNILSLIVIDSFYTFQAKAFLGYSHIVIGIYTFWFVKNKKYVTKAIELDTNPRLILVPSLGMIGIGRTKKEAKTSIEI